MTNLNCPRCGLAIRWCLSLVELDLCPRCLGRTGTQVPMNTSQRTAPPNGLAAGRPPA
jgi:Zn-finger nucleic acid-binding protein